MTGFAISSVARSNLLALHSASAIINNKTFNISTENKITNPTDSASALFSAKGLISRSSGLSLFLSSVNNSTNALKSASISINSIIGFLNEAKTIAQTALNESLGVKLTSRLGFDEASVADLTASTVSTGSQFKITLDKNTNKFKVFTITTGLSLEALISQISTIEDLSAIAISADSGKVKLQLTTTNNQKFIISDLGQGTAVQDLFGTSSANLTIPPISSFPKDKTSLDSQFNLIKKFSVLLTKIDNIVSYNNFGGSNLLNGDNVIVKLNEKNISNISGVNFKSLELGLNKADFSSIASINSTLDKITTALNTLKNQNNSFKRDLSILGNKTSSSLGLINLLKKGTDNIILKDLNPDGAALVSLKSSQKIGIESLSLTSVKNNLALKLLLG